MTGPRTNEEAVLRREIHRQALGAETRHRAMPTVATRPSRAVARGRELRSPDERSPTRRPSRRSLARTSGADLFP